MLKVLIYSFYHFLEKKLNFIFCLLIRMLVCQVTIGQRNGLSSIDALQANLLYKDQCARRPGGGGGGGK